MPSADRLPQNPERSRISVLININHATQYDHAYVMLALPPITGTDGWMNASIRGALNSSGY